MIVPICGQCGVMDTLLVGWVRVRLWGREDVVSVEGRLVDGIVLVRVVGVWVVGEREGARFMVVESEGERGSRAAARMSWLAVCAWDTGVARSCWRGRGVVMMTSTWVVWRPEVSERITSTVVVVGVNDLG